MRKYFVPYVGYSDAVDLLSAYRRWLSDIRPDLFVTLNFNRPLVINSAQNQFKEWMGRTDRRILGCNWYKRPSHERTLALGVIENPTRNLHIHVAVKFPPKAAPLSRSRLLTILATSWEKLEPAGQFNSQPIDDVDRLGSYLFKQLTRRGHLEKCIVLSSDFHHPR